MTSSCAHPAAQDRAAAAIATEPVSRLRQSQHPLRVLSLFAGIGGFDLGLERTGGFKTVAFCEVKPFARRVLAARWPGVPIYGDVRELTARRLAADGITIDAICGGFPCQDISPVGTRLGIEGLRSGLWSEFARLVRELRPKFVFVENSADLLRRGFGDVLGDLADCGYDAEWSVFSACRMGAPHARDRLFLVAYPNGQREEAGGAKRDGDGAAPYARRIRPEHVHSAALAIGSTVWTAPAGEPELARVADGVPDRVDRNDALGNAVNPQIPELIGRALLAAIAIEAGTAATTTKIGAVRSTKARAGTASPESPSR